MTPPRLSFFDELREQRWDDHRFYHQSRINQALHLFSACCFLVTYALIGVEPGIAAVLGWVVAMCSRQIGHFFFEPTSFDTVNQLSFQAKEDIKVGFNLERKVILLSVWVAIPLLFWLSPTLGGVLPAPQDARGWLDRIGEAWLALALAGLTARTAYLMITRNPQTGLVWFTKILTDPFNDVRTYYKSPLYLLRGELLDPMDHVAQAHPAPEVGQGA